MGNRTSKSSSTGKNKDISNSQTLDNSNQNNLDISFKSLNNSIEDTSTYNGITSNKNNNKSQQSENCNSDLLTQEKTGSDVNSKLMYKIWWKEQCNEVFITGKFCDWKQKFKMKKNENNNYFEIEIPIINIIKERSEFKFIVDETWKISDNYPSDKDQNGYTNNYIDSNFINAHISDLISGNNNIVNNILLNKSKDNSTDTKKSTYGTIYPSEDQLNQEAPKIPDVLYISIKLDDFTNQKKIGNDKYLSFSQINLDSSYKNIFQPAHSYVNHLLTKRNNIKSKKRKKKSNDLDKTAENNGLNMNYIRINCNAKFKSKCLSIIYFSPLEDENTNIVD